MTTVEEARAAELLAWCAEHDVTVRWGEDRAGPLVTVEVPAPGRPWQIVRGKGDTFAAALTAARRALEDVRAGGTALRRGPG